MSASDKLPSRKWRAGEGRDPSRPVRLQLSRAKGFDLQRHSLAHNGLSAVSVARPTRWGNPFMVNVYGQEGAVDRFRRLMNGPMSAQEMSISSHWGYGSLVSMRRVIFAGLARLQGRNLACWCSLNEACHADVLLDLANAETRA